MTPTFIKIQDRKNNGFVFLNIASVHSLRPLPTTGLELYGDRSRFDVEDPEEALKILVTFGLDPEEFYQHLTP